MGINLYGYVEGNPVNFNDPSGLIFVDPTGTIPDDTNGPRESGHSECDCTEKLIDLGTYLTPEVKLPFYIIKGGIIYKLSGKFPPINKFRQKLHTDGTQGKSQFKKDVDVDNIIEDAWRNGKPQFNKDGKFIGKVKQYSDEVGTKGEKSVDVRFNRNHGIHGFPSNKKE